ncbi:MAG: lytic transglycosylase domain-containing protein [Pseudomonadota bacterium]
MKRLAGILSILALLTGSGVLADEPEPFPDFTFKKVTPPKAGSGKRIRVQIDTATGAIKAPSVTQDTAPAAKPVYEWYWAEVSPKLEDKSVGRLEAAVNHLSKAPGGQGVSAPRMQFMQNIAQTYGTEILKATIGTNVSPALVLAVIAVESAGKKDAVSSAGAVGLMQLMPATAERFGVMDRTIPASNIQGGVAYLDQLMSDFDNDAIFVLASYNAGENAVRKHGGVPPFNETRAYVPKVLAAWTVARGLCITPPELVSDGCVFAIQGAG